MQKKIGNPQLDVTFQGSTRCYNLKQGRTTIGRRPDSDVLVLDLSVSSQHAVITIAGDKATIEDLGSTNGVYINRKKIKRSHELVDGMRIAIGLCRLVFKANGASSGDCEGAQLASPSHGMDAAQIAAPTKQLKSDISLATAPLAPTQTPKSVLTRAMMPAYLEFITATKSGIKRMDLNKTVNPLGSLGVGVSAISFGKKGWVLTHVDGLHPMLNGIPVTSVPVALKNGDVIAIGDMQARFAV